MSQRVYSKLQLAYSGTYQYINSSVDPVVKNNVIGDPNYQNPISNHPTCIDVEDTNNKIKLSNFTSSFDNVTVLKFYFYDLASGLLIYSFAPFLTFGQEYTFVIAQGSYKIMLVFEKTNPALPMFHGDVELKNVTDNIILATDSSGSDLIEFATFHTLLGKEYQVIINPTPP